MITFILILLALLIPVAVCVGVYAGNRIEFDADSQYVIDYNRRNAVKKGA